MRKKIVAIGLRTNQSQNIFSGQSMMFEAFVEYLTQNNFDVHVIDLNSRHINLLVGSISFRRILEYFKILITSVKYFYIYKGNIMYITTAQTKGGFIRDFIFINIAKCFKFKILIQQFGSNFSNFYNSLSPILKYFVRNTFRKGEYIIVEGEYTKQQFSILKDYQSKVLPISNGLPEKNLQISKIAKHYKQNEPFNLIFLSYMIETKGYWDVLEAVNILVNKMNQNVKCVFSGIFKSSIDDCLFKNEKEAKKSFLKFIIDHNLLERITYYEGLMGVNKAEAFINSHVFLLPSYFKFEGQPVSVLEAMAYGSVPIVTNYRLIPDMVTTNTGFFVDAKSPSQIVETIIYLINNPSEYTKYSQACIDRYNDKFTLREYCNNLLNVLNLL